VSAWMITRTDIAEIHEALGNHWQASVYRQLDEPDADKATATEVSDGVAAVLDGVPEPLNARLKHGEDCWHKHAACLADRVREVLP
jgi:hypothetical protein